MEGNIRCCVCKSFGNASPLTELGFLRESSFRTCMQEPDRSYSRLKHLSKPTCCYRTKDDNSRLHEHRVSLETCLET